MEKKFAQGLCFYKLFWIFLFGCVFGAYYEEILNLVVHYNFHHEFIWQLRRGVIFGPLSPIYGMGAILMLVVLKRKELPDWKLFLYGALIGGAFEYYISFFQELFLHTVSWDYTNELLNINGRTTIPFAFVWGLLAVVLVKIIYPSISNVVEALPLKFGTIFTNILIVLVIFDFAFSWGDIFRQSFRHSGYPPISILGEYYDKYYPDTVLKESYTNSKMKEVKK